MSREFGSGDPFLRENPRECPKKEEFKIKKLKRENSQKTVDKQKIRKKREKNSELEIETVTEPAASIEGSEQAVEQAGVEAGETRVANGLDSTLIQTAETPDATLPSADKMNAILSKAKKVSSVALMSQAEIDKLVRQRQEAIDEYQDIVAKESSLKTTKPINPFDNLEPSDYQRLVQEKIITEESVKCFIEIDNEIAKFQSLPNPSLEAKTQLETLLNLRNSVKEGLESKIKEEQQKTAIKNEEQIRYQVEVYKERAQKLDKIISEIGSNPRVRDYLHTIAEKEMEEFFDQREREKKEYETKVAKIRQEIIDTSARFVQSLKDRYNNAFKRLEVLFEDKEISDKLAQILDEKDEQKQRDGLAQARKHLIKSIIEGEGVKQLKNPAEIIPWADVVTSIPHGTAMNYLDNSHKDLQIMASLGNERAKKLLEQYKQIIKSNEIIRRLVGPKWYTDPNSKEKRLSRFYTAFEQRKKNDRDGTTARHKREREEAIKREAKFREVIKGIIERGGFILENAPIINGAGKWAVRLERKKSKKSDGKYYWEVVEMSAPVMGLKVGDTSPLNMGSFIEWFRTSSRKFFVMHGDDRLERLIYKPEEQTY